MLNVELLQKVKAHILEEPNRLVMNEWIWRRSVQGDDATDVVGDHCVDVKMPPCGTAGCIAGWCCLLTQGIELAYRWKAKTTARDLLGLDRVPDELFYVQTWPEKFQHRWNDTETAQERAEVVAAVIDDFIAKNGEQVSC